jgi:hypothetical protein
MPGPGPAVHDKAGDGAGSSREREGEVREHAVGARLRAATPAVTAITPKAK